MFVDAFLSNYAIHGDFAKPSKFAALIYQPPGLVAGGLFGGLIGQNRATQQLGRGLNVASLAFQCESAQLPGYQINTVEQRVYGAPWHTAATPAYQPLELTFICAGDMWERKFFDDWMEFMLPKESERVSVSEYINAGGEKTTQGLARYRDEYISSIQVIQFHDTGIPSNRFYFEEAFPVNVAPMPVNWGDDGIHRLNVTFQYRTWRREPNVIKQVFDAFRT